MNTIISNKEVLGGRNRLRNTRMAIDVIATYLSNGYNINDIKKDYPKLTLGQISAAIQYLDNQIHNQKVQIESQTT